MVSWLLITCRSTKSKTKEGKSSKSKVSETDPWLNEGRKAITQRAGEFLNNVGQELDALSKEYASILKSFNSQLPNQQHIDLKFLVFRLDFNQFYSLNDRQGERTSAIWYIICFIGIIISSSILLENHDHCCCFLSQIISSHEGQIPASATSYSNWRYISVLLWKW